VVVVVVVVAAPQTPSTHARLPSAAQQIPA